MKPPADLPIGSSTSCSGVASCPDAARRPERRGQQAPRITIVTSRLDRGGTERHLTRIVPELRRRGIDITLYLMERGGPLEGELLAQAVPIEGPTGRGFMHWLRGT